MSRARWQNWRWSKSSWIKYLRRRSRLQASGRSIVAIRSGSGEIAHWPEMAKRLRYAPDIYARYGGIAKKSHPTPVPNGMPSRSAAPRPGSRLGSPSNRRVRGMPGARNSVDTVNVCDAATTRRACYLASGTDAGFKNNSDKLLINSEAFGASSPNRAHSNTLTDGSAGR